MKNTLKMFGIIAIAAVIGFCSVSCGDDDSGGGNAISGNTITSGAEVVYDSSIDDVAEAKKVTDFGFMHYWDEKNDTDELKPLSYFLDGSPSVSVNNNKVTINLGTPKSVYLYNFPDELGESVTINPINANLFGIGFRSSDGKYSLGCRIKDNNYVQLYYVDRNANIKGSFTQDNEEDGVFTDIYNVSLKKGWNYIIYSYNETTNTGTYTSSTTQPNGLKWTVYENDYYR